jgi:phosphotransferase system  glucose/maltose/N-acetylglucosamine-specific IIC component
MKSTIIHILIVTAIWLGVFFVLDIVGGLISSYFTMISSVLGRGFLATIVDLIQKALLFGFVFAIAFVVSKKRAIAYFLYVFVQIVVFHVCFLLLINFQKTPVAVETTTDNFFLQYLFFYTSDFSFLSVLLFPVYGIFDGGMFLPDSLLNTYVLLVLSPLLTSALVCWLTMLLKKTIDNRFGNNSFHHTH